MRFILIIIIIVFTTIIVLQFDDDLSPKAENWISVLEEGRLGGSEAFIYLSGIMAAENDDVISVGKKGLQHIESLRRRSDYRVKQ